MVQMRYGDLAKNLMLNNTTSTTKQALTRLSQEVTTGLSSDTAHYLSGNLGQINAIDSTLSHLSAFKTATSELGARALATQTALGTFASLADKAQSALLVSTGTVSAAQVTTGAQTARSALETMISTLNSQFAGRSLFAGTAVTGPAVADYDAIMTALETATGAALSAADAATTVSEWFDDPAGYLGTAYLGRTAEAQVTIAEGEQVSLSVTGQDAALRNLMKGLAMGALVDRGLFAGQPESRKDLAAIAGQALLAAQDGVTHLSAELGIKEARIADAAIRNSTEITALGLARVDLVGVDSYESSTQLTDAEARLQLLYALTARLSKLSLAEYL